jgi:hypothetical protein
MQPTKSVLSWTLGLLAGAVITAAAQQLPLEPIRERGQGVYPVYEGWYKNADGTFTLLVGYFNRNTREAIDVPVGPNNRVEPGGPDLGQPTHFEPRRGWGVFTIKVPADFGTKKIVWTVNANGLNASVPMHLDPNWFIEPFEDAASKNRPPMLRFEPGGRPFAGPPDGIRAELTALAGEPLLLALFATDVKPTANIAASRAGPSRERLDVTWSLFRGPGKVVFSTSKPPLEKADGRANTTATFDRPGEYVLRVEANDETGEGGGGFQCCWTSVHVRVTVRPAVQTTGHN